ncbi:MAG: hypothetical protein OXD44_05815, partial [Gammaproteobacteria bacterium]|nr:hypothetical protein [Gammaproteobacteria bacterium]
LYGDFSSIFYGIETGLPDRQCSVSIGEVSGIIFCKSIQDNAIADFAVTLLYHFGKKRLSESLPARISGINTFHACCKVFVLEFFF